VWEFTPKRTVVEHRDEQATEHGTYLASNDEPGDDLDFETDAHLGVSDSEERGLE
jgi:hypothetical protein